MGTNVVNLDALIPRDDFAVSEAPSRATPLDRINIAHLDGHFFAGDLRKPDFQRETAQWTPAKVVDLIRSFLDADLIPGIILWRAGTSIFVIDGAHRLSAMLAWILDDYGDRKKSLDHSGGYITEEQRRVAERTRDLVAKSVASYAQYQAFRNNRAAAPAGMQKRLSNLADNSFVAQWVTATDATSAEESFFKINQQGTPIDPTERRLIRSRESASAIASRSITHAGSGHKYWSSFVGETQAAIETTGKEIYNALYNPPITGMPLTTLDVPVAGKGYNVLPFVFDLVNYANNVKIADSTSKKDDKTTTLPKDTDGTITVQFLREVRRKVDRITGDAARSLGLHPVVYFYTRSGTFQPTVFLAVSGFVEELQNRNKLIEFTKHRREFEEFLIAHKEATTLLIKQLGSGARHIPRLREYYGLILKGLVAGKSQSQIEDDLSSDASFAFLTKMPAFALPPDPVQGDQAFKRGTKTAAFFAAALPKGARCNLCGALVHKNSIQFDHDTPRRAGGSAALENARVSHPYCNSIKDHLTGIAK
jgi:Protein of unknown function DUF262/HNH endonuclease